MMNKPIVSLGRHCKANPVFPISEPQVNLVRCPDPTVHTDTPSQHCWLFLCFSMPWFPVHINVDSNVSLASSSQVFLGQGWEWGWREREAGQGWQGQGWAGQGLVLEILMQVVNGKDYVSLRSRKGFHGSAPSQLYGFVQVLWLPELWVSPLCKVSNIIMVPRGILWVPCRIWEVSSTVLRIRRHFRQYSVLCMIECLSCMGICARNEATSS